MQPTISAAAINLMKKSLMRVSNLGLHQDLHQILQQALVRSASPDLKNRVEAKVLGEFVKGLLKVGPQDLPLRLGRGSQFTDYPECDYLAASCSNAEDVLKLLPVISSATNTFLQANYSHVGDSVAIDLHLDPDSWCDMPASYEYGVACFDTMIRRGIEGVPAISKVEFAHAPLLPIERYRDLLGTDDVVFHAERCRFYYGEEILRCVGRSPSPAIFAAMADLFADTQALHGKQRLENWLKATIRAHLDNPRLNLDFVAKEMDMAPRTLQRQLTKQGVTFRDVLTKTRMDFAKARLQKSDARVQDIAKAAGYGSVAAFSNAFLAHFGYRPTSVKGSGEPPASAETSL